MSSPRASWLGQILAVAQKDLAVEWRARTRISGVFFFALALLVLIAYAVGPDTNVLREQAGGYLWIAVFLASTRALDQSMTIELENGSLEGMVLWPVSPIAVFYGKALATTALLLGVTAALWPLTVALFDVHVAGNPLLLPVWALLGCAALAAPGTLYATMTSQARGASVLLPILLFPLVVPAMIAVTRGTVLLLEGDPMLQGSSWMGLLGAFDALHWSLSGLLYSKLVDDG